MDTRKHMDLGWWKTVVAECESLKISPEPFKYCQTPGKLMFDLSRGRLNREFLRELVARWTNANDS